MAAYDLTPRIAPHLDRHLVFPLFEFLQERHLHPDEEILKSKIELLSQTNMVDYAMDIHKNLYHTDEVPQEMVERRVDVMARLKSLEEAAAPIVAFLQNPNSVQVLRRRLATILILVPTTRRHQRPSPLIESVKSYVHRTCR